METIEERPVRAASAADELGDRYGRGCRISRGGTFHVDADRDTAVAAKVEDGFQTGDPQTGVSAGRASAGIQSLQLDPTSGRSQRRSLLSFPPAAHASSRGDRRDSSAHRPR